MKRSPVIVLFGGWFGSRNAGDEAIMLANVHLIRREVPDAEILVHTIDPDYTLGLADVGVISTGGKKTMVSRAGHLMRSYAKADLFVITGGTPIFDFRLMSRLFHFGIPMAARVPMGFLGIGMKPVSSHRGRLLYRFFLERARHVSVRDPEVISGLRSIGFSGRSDLTADSAVALPRGDQEQLDEALARNGLVARPFVAFAPVYLSVTDPNSHYHEAVTANDRDRAYQAMAEAADLAVEHGLSAAFFAMHKVLPDDDREPIAIIRGLMKNESLVFEVDEDPILLTDVLERATALVGMRLHSLVLASSRGVPIVAIGFDMKVGGYMRHLGLGDDVIGISEVTSDWVKKRLLRTLEQRSEISNQISHTVRGWQNLIAADVRRLMKVLDESS